MAALVDELPALGQPVGDRKRPVAEPLSERFADRHPRERSTRQSPPADLREQRRGCVQGAD